MTLPLQAPNRPHRVDELRSQIRQLETGRFSRDSDTISSGIPALDRMLPDGGLRRGTLVEWLDAERGSGAAVLSLLAARQACQRGGTLVVSDAAGQFYPPAVVGWGIPLQRLIVLRPRNAQDEWWAIDQALRCQGVAAVWGTVGWIEERLFRRFQLSAESSGCIGLFQRPAHDDRRSNRDRRSNWDRQPSWAELRLMIKPCATHRGRRIQVHLLRCRGGTTGGQVVLEMDETTGSIHQVDSHHETHPLPLAPSLAGSTVGCSTSGT